MISWPAFIYVDGDDELTYIASYEQWINHPEWSTVEYSADDVLVDSTGRIYHLDNMVNDRVMPASTDQVISLNQLVIMVQRHAALNNACCIEKIGFRNTEEGLAIIASLSEE